MEKSFQIPTEICREAKQFMKRVTRHMEERGVAIREGDHGGLELMAWTYHHWFKANETVNKEGYIVKETNARGTAITKIHPAVKIAYDCNAQLRQLLVEYGLTPKSRNAVGGIQGDLWKQNPQLSKFSNTA